MITQHQFNQILDTIKTAGEIAINSFASKNFTVKRKYDDSVLSTTDEEISIFISNEIAKITPDIPILSEEDQDFYSKNLEFDKIWVLDPIDGTNNFINNNQQFAINLALINNNKAVIGIIYAPLFDGGKFIFNYNGKVFMIKRDNNFTNKEIISKKTDYNHNNINIITSFRSSKESTNQFILYHLPQIANNFKIIKISSSIKFINLIENQDNIYLHLQNSMIWDTASGQSIIETLCGNIYQIDCINNNENKTSSEKQYFISDKLLECNYKNPKNPYFIASFNFNNAISIPK